MLISYNPKNKKAISKAIALIFNPNNQIDAYIQSILLDSLLWAVTERNDEGKKEKYVGQPYWSIGALNQLLNNKGAGIELFKDLRHEHAVPRSIIKDKILALSTKSEIEIYKIIDKFGHAVILSRDEDELLNKKHKTTSPNLEDVLSRYKDQKISVCKIPNKFDLKILVENDLSNFEKMY
jgi:hypothetical protein